VDQKQWIERLRQLAGFFTWRSFQAYSLKCMYDLMLCISPSRKIKQHAATNIE
jgi:hypothetical protein